MLSMNIFRMNKSLAKSSVLSFYFFNRFLNQGNSNNLKELLMIKVWIIVNRVPTHSHPLPSTLTHLYSFAAYSHLFPLFFSSLSLIFSLLPVMFSSVLHIQSPLPPAPVQPLSPISSPNPNSLTQSNALHTCVLMCFCVLRARVPM